MDAGTDFSKLLEEKLTCSICNNIFKDPRILQCYHKFCFKCIEEWIEQCSKEEQPSTCPICKKTIGVPGGKVSELQPSYYMETLHNLLNILQNTGMDDNELPSCVSCDKSCKPTSFCAQCEGMICNDCVKIHNTIKVFKNEHQAILLNSFKHDHVNSYIRSQLRCHEKSHEQNKLEYYCQTCTKCICQKCAISSHNDHLIVSVEEASESYQDKQLKSIDVQSVTDLKDKHMKVFEESKTEVESYGEETDKAIRKVRDTTLHYMEIIREHEMLMIAKLNELYREKLERFEFEATKIKSAVSFLQEFDLQGQALQDRNIVYFILESQHELPQNQELVKSQLSSLAESKHSAAKPNLSVEYVPNSQATQYLKDLGKVVESVKNTDTTSVTTMR